MSLQPQTTPKAAIAPPTTPKPRSVHDCTFAGQIRCGATTATYVENKGAWGLEPDYDRRVMVVSRVDEHERVHETIVPFENVLQFRYARTDDGGQP
jgi:hypothetical protein